MDFVIQKPSECSKELAIFVLLAVVFALFLQGLDVAGFAGLAVQLKLTALLNEGTSELVPDVLRIAFD